MICKYLENWTAQQVFEKVGRHLLDQGRPSVVRTSDGHHDMCRYRTPDGLECAAGCLIPEEEYTVSLETKGWHTMSELSRVPAKHVDLIGELQMVHDVYSQRHGHENVKQFWHRKLHAVARLYKLDPAFLDEYVDRLEDVVASTCE